METFVVWVLQELHVTISKSQIARATKLNQMRKSFCICGVHLILLARRTMKKAEIIPETAIYV